MSEAGLEFRPRPSRRARAMPRRRRADRRGLPIGARSIGEPSYPLDPPLEDVRIPVKAPHAAATAYSYNALQYRFPSFSLTPKRREPLEEVALPTGERGVRSTVLRLVAYVTERTPPSEPDETWKLTMRWHDPATRTDIPDYEESRAREAALIEEAQARAEARLERERADAAQHRVVELEGRLRRLHHRP